MIKLQWLLGPVNSICSCFAIAQNIRWHNQSGGGLGRAYALLLGSRGAKGLFSLSSHSLSHLLHYLK